jgi:hypothetical protein
MRSVRNNFGGAITTTMQDVRCFSEGAIWWPTAWLVALKRKKGESCWRQLSPGALRVELRAILGRTVCPDVLQ